MTAQHLIMNTEWHVMEVHKPGCDYSTHHVTWKYVNQVVIIDIAESALHYQEQYIIMVLSYFRHAAKFSIPANKNLKSRHICQLPDMKYLIPDLPVSL